MEGATPGRKGEGRRSWSREAIGFPDPTHSLRVKTGKVLCYINVLSHPEKTACCSTVCVTKSNMAESRAKYEVLSTFYVF